MPRTSTSTEPCSGEDPRGEVRRSPARSTTRTTWPALAGRLRRDKIIVSYHGVDLDRFQPLPRHGRRRVPHPDGRAPCASARACPTSSRPAASWPTAGSPSNARSSATGQDRRSLERPIRRAGPRGSREDHGLSEPRKISSRSTSRPSVVVLPALSESHFGIPNILLEALAVETPVICTPLPSLSEVMEDGVHGLFVPEQSPHALAAAPRIARPRPRAVPGHGRGRTAQDRGALRRRRRTSRRSSPVSIRCQPAALAIARPMRCATSHPFPRRTPGRFDQ